MADTDYRNTQGNAGNTSRADDTRDLSRDDDATGAARQRAREDDNPENRDPLSGAPGAHPVGTGVGAAVGGAAVGAGAGWAAGAAAGAAMGTAAGPVGTVVGTAVGAIIGGLAGKAVAERANPTEEHAYWRSNYQKRPYVQQGATYDDYGPAYQYGWESRERHANADYSSVESDLKRDWEKTKGKSKLEWDKAKHAIQDSWNRRTQRDADVADATRPDQVTPRPNETTQQGGTCPPTM